MKIGEEFSSMIAVTFGGLLLGAVLGTRFRVFVIIPAAIFGLILVALVAVVKGAAISSVVIAIVTYAISLQIGYLVGLFTRYLMVATRAALHRSWRSDVART